VFVLVFLSLPLMSESYSPHFHLCSQRRERFLCQQSSNLSKLSLFAGLGLTGLWILKTRRHHPCPWNFLIWFLLGGLLVLPKRNRPTLPQLLNAIASLLQYLELFFCPPRWKGSLLHWKVLGSQVEYISKVCFILGCCRSPWCNRSSDPITIVVLFPTLT
jgi:hypothetical protein